MTVFNHGDNRALSQKKEISCLNLSTSHDKRTFTEELQLPLKRLFKGTYIHTTVMWVSVINYFPHTRQKNV